MMRPLIGLNTSLTKMDDPLKSQAVCHLKYIDAVAGAGGVPIIVPPYTDRSMLPEVLEKLDGFLLIGGDDYLPEHYGGHPQPPEELLPPRRHHFDLWLAEYLLDRSKQPVLGICGGHQLLNIARGGALVQDLKTEWQPPEKSACTLLHANDYRKDTPQHGDVYRHEVRIDPASRLAKIVGATKLLTNSYHHQAVQPQRIGSGFAATAWAPDGVIEALEAPGERFIVGVQWHPERQTTEAQHLAIFKALIDAAK